MSLLAKILRVGLATEPLEPGDAAAVELVRQVEARTRRLLGRALGDPAGRRRILQRLRARDQRPHEPRVRHRALRHPLRRLAPARGPPAGHRPGHAQHGGAAPEDVRGDARPEARGRGGRLRQDLRRLPGELRRRRQRRPDHPRGRLRGRVPSGAGGHPPGHPGGARPPVGPSVPGDRHVAHPAALPGHGPRPCRRGRRRSPGPDGRGGPRPDDGGGDRGRRRRARAGPRHAHLGHPVPARDPGSCSRWRGASACISTAWAHSSSWSSRSWPSPARSSAGPIPASTRGLTPCACSGPC